MVTRKGIVIEKGWKVHIRPVGFKDRDEFMQAWNTINGSWNPDTIVTVYEFKLLKDEKDEPIY